MQTKELLAGLKNHEFDERLKALYVDEAVLEHQRARYIAVIEKYVELYGDGEVEIYSAPGRSEVGGNHTDHQHGRVLATSINLDAIGVVGKVQDTIKVLSDSFDIAPINVNETEKVESEEGTSESLIRGVVSKFKELGFNVGGFNAYCTSEVLVGAGMSSSAAFEVLIGTILSNVYNEGKVDAVEIAKIGQYAENVYFGKPCGLMDQCASAVGGLINIDFIDPSKPVVRHVDVDFAAFKHSLCIVDTKGSHADLTPDYAAVPQEMKAVAAYFGKEVLMEVNEDDFYANIADIREKCGDRAVLRSMHLFEENKRVDNQVAALLNNDFDTFKYWLMSSGKSSYEYLQNVYSPRFPDRQAVSVALALTEKIVGKHGAWRVHGGGFAGTIQAFVEDDYVETYKAEIEKCFGEGACHVLKVRPEGGVKVIG